MAPQAATFAVRRVLVTGISGNLGRRLAPLLAGYEVLSIDLHPPPPGVPAGRFFPIDLSEPAGQQKLANLIATERVDAVLHLAFVIDPVRTGIVDEKRMWQVNVSATQRLLEAIATKNRDGLSIRLFVFPSSVSAYGPDLPNQVTEDAPLLAHTFPYALHKREADEICQRMHSKLNGCATYVFRPHIYAGATVDNFILRSFRGKASGRGWIAQAFEKKGWKVPVLLPRSAERENFIQFVHVDDVARVLLWTLDNFRPGHLAIFNLAGPGAPISFDECASLARTPIVRLPSEKLVTGLLRFFWWIGLSGVPPQALPYFLGSYTMDTTRLFTELGVDCRKVLKFSSRDAFLDALCC